jgi:RNA-dependent RNA polymerase
VSLALQSYQLGRIPDVTRNGYCFSDGVGRISADLCEAMAERLAQLGRCPASHIPSAYQIRYSGCKGMVTLHPGLCGRR